MSTSTSSNELLREKVKLSPPKRFTVTMYNDDVTSAEFVIAILQAIFHKNYETATLITQTIHENGKEIVGTYSEEIAKQKVIETISVSRYNGFPLMASFEPVE